MSFEYNMVLVGVLLFAVGIPLVLKLVPPNPVYGVRTAKAFSSREVWYAANRSAGITMAITGIVIAVVALVGPRLLPGYSEGARVLTVGAIIIFAVVVMVVKILWQVRRM
jgi:uncharacterized membrane protein